MREFLDDILDFIGSESLTDDEFDALEIDAQEYSKATYDALLAILQARENVSEQTQKLELYFTARGVDHSAASDPKIAQSEIFIGSEL